MGIFIRRKLKRLEILIRLNLMFRSSIQQITFSEIMSMSEVNYWLNETRETYRLACIEEEKSQKDLVRLANGAEIKRTFFNDAAPDYLLLMDLHQALDKLAGYHQYEVYFKQELENYKSISQSEKQVQKWIIKNMHLGFEKFSTFEVEYLDYEGNEEFDEENCPIKLFFLHMPELDLYINRYDFRFTLEFIDLFHFLLYENNLLSHSVKEDSL